MSSLVLINGRGQKQIIQYQSWILVEIIPQSGILVMKNTINNGFDSLLHSFEGLKRTKIFYKQLDDYGNISTLKGDKNIVSGFEHHQHSQNRLWFKMHSDSHKH